MGIFTVTQSRDLNDSKKPVETINGFFSFLIKDCRWKVRWSQSNEPFDYQEMGTDGTNVYTLRSAESLVQKLRKEGKKIPNELNGEITQGNIPNPGVAHVIPGLWWVFASACYLDADSGPLYTPIYYNELTYAKSLHVLKVYQPAQIVRNAREPRLPRSVIFMDSGVKNDWRTPASALWLPMESTARKIPYDKGFTNCVLQVLSYTNLNSLELPSAAEIRIFAPKVDGKKSDDLEWRKLYSITTTNVAIADSEIETVPQVAGTILAGDLRFANRKPRVLDLGYFAEKKWLDDSHVMKLQAYEKALSKMTNGTRIRMGIDQANSTVASAGGRSTPIVVILAVLSVSTLWLLLKVSKKQPN